MKRRACFVVASELTLRAFLAPHLRALQEHYDLTVVVNTGNRDLLRDLAVAGTLRPLAIVRPISPWHDVRSLFSLMRLMRAGRFDLVHSMTPKAGLLAMVAAWLTRVPARVHTFTGQVWVTRSGPSRPALKLLDRLMAACATFTLADSASQREFLISERIAPAGKLAVLGEGSVSGVDAGRFHPAPAVRRAMRQRMGISDTDVVHLFVGRLHRDKGVLDLAGAFAALAGERSDVHLLFVGPDEQDLRPAIERICGHHAGRIHFVDFTEAPEEAMAASDVLCLPSYREGFGSVIIEAAACGLPAVASRIYGIVDAVQDGHTGLLHQPADVSVLLNHLRRITEDAALRVTLGEQARRRALRDFPQSSITSALRAFHAGLFRSRRPGWYSRYGKRAFDLAGACVAILLLLPVAACVGLLVRVCLGSPVLFRQRRPGLHGVPFEMVKFRSMVERHDAGGEPLPDAVRLTPPGRFLRALSLDEIPELWNVVRGDMSLVGPRPLLMQYLPLYTPEQARRHDVRPGITGLAQITGRNELSWARRFELDLRYVETCSLRLDLSILARTALAVIARRGISQPGQATVDYFRGNVQSNG